MGKTFVEKILAHKAGLADVVPGQTVVVEPDIVMTHDNTAAILKTFEGIEPGIKVRFPERHVIILDHCTPAANETHAKNHKEIREFVHRQGLPHFHDIHTGICHQVVAERYAKPGLLIVGSDSHTVMSGALGALAVPIDRVEAAGLFAEGRTWLMVPQTFKVELTGAFCPGVTAKDLILTFIGDISASGADYRCVEFHGPGAEAMSIDDRLTVANMIIEAGAKCAFFAPDDQTRDYVRQHAGGEWTEFHPDPGAVYERTFHYDLSQLQAVVSAPHNVDKVKPAAALAGTKVDQVLLGTCTNGRLSDLRAAVDILQGRHIAPSVRLLIIPASQAVLLDALAHDLIRPLIAAGGTLINPGCGPCMGNHEGILAPGETCLSTANRNFKGRMGCKESFIYLANPVTAACTALTGVITDYSAWRKDNA